ncbi:2%2C3-dimethylmalate dehydratase large subunit [uncultured Eubacterium sp.]|nr:2%2C3-dimethylmalate dehydratase large subunit [uncultured Eubacterium sp.]
MVKLYDKGAYLVDGIHIVSEEEGAVQNLNGKELRKEDARKGTIAYSILSAHNTSGNMDKLQIKFDAMTSHDITFVGIIQTARASGMEKFPIPYVLTNCHNSLCAVGGTINEDDHMFGLSAAQKYGGIYVPPHIAVIHQYMRETMAGCGKMILGSDSHTRYGALGTMAIGEGGGELVKQLLCDTYDIAYPKVIGIYLDGKPNPGIGPQDIALAIIGAVYKSGYVKNCVMEFVGPGISNMTTDYRNGIDVMTTETTCLSSIWRTDEDTKAFLTTHGRADAYKELNPADVAYYDGMVYVDLSTVKPMIALPFHPSNTYEIDELNANLSDILREVEKEAAAITENPDVNFSLTDKIDENGHLRIQQGIIAGCAGGNYTNMMEAARILENANCGNGEFALSVYPSSQPVFMDLVKKGAISKLMAAGAVVKTAFCGPCFGAGDTPANNALSIRHTTRNFPNREGSKPGVGQLSAVALMDARSIAATAANGGILTPATEYAEDWQVPEYEYDDSAYESRIYHGYSKANEETPLIFGPNIKDWPEMKPLSDHILLKVCSKIMDPVTTTDELIPSGETSSYRSNPLGLAEFALSRRDPGYVQRAKDVQKLTNDTPELATVFDEISKITPDASKEDVEIGSMIYCVKPGDGSAREQAASCQRVLGGLANICSEYATKRYRSNVMNWGMVPFQMKDEPEFGVGDYIYVPDVKKALDGDMKDIKAYVIGDQVKEISLYISDMTPIEKEIVKAGCLINYNRNKNNK